MELKACRDVNPNLFFPEDPKFRIKDEPGNPGEYCMHCPVRVACLDFALLIELRDGIYGGTNEHQRRQMINDSTTIRRRLGRLDRQRKREQLIYDATHL
jgi:WhiB family transcriptional regulator, redox-sensing transcriptional regulator